MLKNIKNKFPWFKKNPQWVYADSSATSLKPKCVIDAITNYYECYGTNPHNNDSPLASHVNQFISETRNKVAKFFGVEEKEIIFTSGATESLNLVIHNLSNKLKKGDEVVISYGEHSSNLIPWIDAQNKKGVKLVYAGDEKKHNAPTTEAFIQAITPKTKVLSFSASSNVFGYNLDIRKITKAAKKISPNIIVLVDGTQTAPHHPTNLKLDGVDFFVCSAHKMCGPDGVGVLYGKFEELNKLTPLKIGGGGVSTVALDGASYNLAPLPGRLESGTPNTAGIIGFGAAIDFLNSVGMKNIDTYEKELKKYFDKRIKEVKNIEYVSQTGLYPVCSFNVRDIISQDLANYLGRNKIIARSGLSCAKLSYEITSNKSGYVRVSLYFYNTTKDIDRIISVLKKFKKSDVVDNIF